MYHYSLRGLDGCYTDYLLQVSPGDAMEVFILCDQELAIDGCQGERWVVQVELIAGDVAHCGRLGRGYLDGGYIVQYGSWPDELNQNAGSEYR